MSRLVLLLVVIVYLAGSCRKAANNTPSLLPANTWQVGATKFEEHYSEWVKEKLPSVTDSVMSLYMGTYSNYPDALILSFTHKPGTAQTFKVVANPGADDEVAVHTWQNFGSNSYSQDDTGMYITATVINGKMTFTSTHIRLKIISWVLVSPTDCEMNVSE